MTTRGSDTRCAAAPPAARGAHLLPRRRDVSRRPPGDERRARAAFVHHRADASRGAALGLRAGTAATTAKSATRGGTAAIRSARAPAPASRCATPFNLTTAPAAAGTAPRQPSCTAAVARAAVAVTSAAASATAGAARAAVFAAPAVPHLCALHLCPRLVCAQGLPDTSSVRRARAARCGISIELWEVVSKFMLYLHSPSSEP